MAVCEHEKRPVGRQQSWKTTRTGRIWRDLFLYNRIQTRYTTRSRSNSTPRIKSAMPFFSASTRRFILSDPNSTQEATTIGNRDDPTTPAPSRQFAHTPRFSSRARKISNDLPATPATSSQIPRAPQFLASTGHREHERRIQFRVADDRLVTTDELSGTDSESRDRDGEEEEGPARKRTRSLPSTPDLVTSTRGPAIKRPKFILLESSTAEDDIRPLPQAFSPQRRSQKFIAGGMAAEFASWIVDISQQSRISNTGAQGSEMQVLVTSHVGLSDGVAAEEGDRMTLLEGTVDGADIGLCLLGASKRKGNDSRCRTADMSGNLIAVRKPCWSIDVAGKPWMVATDWNVARDAHDSSTRPD